jgi:hypothetical protein
MISRDLISSIKDQNLLFISTPFTLTVYICVINCNYLIWQHITLQAIGGLQPGAQGHILVKTENGQLQLLRVGSIGPATNAGGIQTTGLGPGGAPGTTTLRFQSVPVSQAQRPGMPMQHVTTTSQGIRLVCVFFLLFPSFARHFKFNFTFAANIC